ncbi:hypothetical protein [Bulleidia sp. zg-1006]|uniref:hypothetical protein n=1 Tax=Bulleidia sp. zg-1006 TaxID=2806552 RepID=UPI001939BF87|nr:hypothetical protein [Bulleidia sp. zg-1006]QRG86920.1 hypothetical protein JOS54_00975 [Bulleidia sp. zg-1006]
MTSFDIKGIVGSSNSQLEVANLTKVFLKPLDLVLGNSENPFELTDIELLERNIEEQGLEEVLTGYLNSDGNVVLYSGHRRLQALKNLFLDEKSYRYHGKDITGSVPILIQPKIENHDEEILKIIGANNHRDLTKEEKERIIDLSLEVIKKKYGFGRVRTRVATLTGIKEAFVGNYLSSKNKKSIGDSKVVDEPKEKDDTVLTATKFGKKLFQATKKLYRLSEEYTDLYLNKLEVEKLMDIMTMIEEISSNMKK